MESHLLSVLLRQEQMLMQWDLEFEQQKQLFHIHTSTLIDMLPIRPRQKRLRVGCRVQPGSILGHDKENLVGFQGFLSNSTCVKSTKAKVPCSRGLAKRDLNTRFCYKDVKDVLFLHSKPAESEPPRLQSALLSDLDVENVQPTGRVARAVRRCKKDSVGVSVVREVAEGEARQAHVSPPTNEMPALLREKRKRIRGGQGDNVILRTCNEEKQEVSKNPEEERMKADQIAEVDLVEKKSKPRRALVIGNAKENVVGVESGVQTSSDAEIARFREPEIADKAKVEPEAVAWREAQAVEATGLDTASKWPTRTGRATGASAAVKAAVPDVVIKEPAQRGRAKKSLTVSGLAVSEISEFRVTRSRARKVENVVESGSGTCDRIVASQVVSKEPVLQRAEVEDSSAKARNVEPKHDGSAAYCGAECEGRLANQIEDGTLETFCKPEVHAPLHQGVTRDESSMKKAAQWKELISAARSREKPPENHSVKRDMEKPVRVNASSHAELQVEVASSHPGADKQCVRIESRVAEVLVSIGNAGAEHFKYCQSESLSESRLERLEEGVGRRVAYFASIRDPLGSRRGGIALQDGSAPLGSSDAPPAEEEAARSAHCLVAPESDALVEEVSVARTKTVSRSQVKVTADGRLASNARSRRPSASQPLSPSFANLLPLGRDHIMSSNATNIKELSRSLPTTSKEGHFTLLSEMIEDSVLPLKKLGGPVSSPESVIVGRLVKPFLWSERSASAPFLLELPDAGRDASNIALHVLPNAVISRRSTVGAGRANWRDVSERWAVSEGQELESNNMFEECGIDVNIQFAERSWHVKGESVEDAVVNTTSEGSRVKVPENATQSLMDTITREQVISNTVSPLRYSEAIEEAMRCLREQEFLRGVTLTLNRLQFRKRLSARSKARARRWRSDIATNGLNHERGQSSEAPAGSLSRVVSSSVHFMKGAAYETFLEAQSPNPEAALGGVDPSFGSGGEEAVDQADTTSWQEHAPQPEGMTSRSTAPLCNEVLSQAIHDGEMGDNSEEYEVVETTDEQDRNLSPLLSCIYKLNEACENEMVGISGFSEEEEQQQVHGLKIEGAKKIMRQASRKGAQAAGAPPITTASDHPALNGSSIYDHTNLYPDRFRLFTTPSIFPVSDMPVVVSVPSSEMESTSPQMKRLTQKTYKEAVSRTPGRDSILSESAVGAHDVVSPARPRTPSSGEIPRTPGTCNIHHSGERESAPDCFNAVGSGSGGLTRTHVHFDSYVHPSTIVRGTSAIGSASPLRGSQNVGDLQSCDGSVLSIVDRVDAVDTAEFVTHQFGVPLSPETIAETEKQSELRSRSYYLSEDSVTIPSTTAKGVPNLLGAGPEVQIKHSTNTPSLTPSLRFSPGYASEKENGARVSVKESPQSSKEVDLDVVENEEPAVAMDGGTKVPCSPMYIGNQHGHLNHHDLLTKNLPLTHHGVQKTLTVEEDVFPKSSTEFSKEAVSCTRSMPAVSANFMQPVKPKGPSNLVDSAPGPVPSSSNFSRSNLASGIRSFIPLVQQMLPAASHLNGKRDVKVKALEAAEAAKRLAEQKELEKQERKNMIAKRENQERAAQEKLAKRQKAALDMPIKQQKARAEKENEGANRRMAALAGTTRPMMAGSSNCQRTRTQNVLLKVKKTYDLKLKMNLDKQERLQEEERRKEEEWKKKEAENVTRKRKHEAAEKKELVEKRRREEEVVKAHRQMEKRQRLELEKKPQKQKALEEIEKERKAIEFRRQKLLDKEMEVEQRRKEEQEKELEWLHEKEVTLKLKYETAKLLETEGREQAGQMNRPSQDTSTSPYHSFMDSLHVAMGIGWGVGAARLSGVNKLVDSQRIRSQSWVGHLRVPQQSGEGVGAAFPPSRDSQAAIRVPCTILEGALCVSNIIGGSGKPSFCAQPDCLGNLPVASVACTSGGASSARALRDGNNVRQGQSGSSAGVSAVAGGNKPCQPGRVGFVGPPGGVIEHREKGVQSYEISPFRDSEDEDSDEEKRFQKPIPQWARKEFLWLQLVRQNQQDPDDIFVGANSCSLDEVFEVQGSKKRPDYKRRGSSGDWVKDCLTWQEQIQYKVTMGYLSQIVN